MAKLHSAKSPISSSYMVHLPTTLPQLIARSLPLRPTHCLAQDKQEANTGVYGRYIVHSVADLFVASVLLGRK